MPELPGLADFGGRVFHSARWDPQTSLAGQRAGVVGTGASAVQIVPAIAPEVASLAVFQRTPAWILPHTGRPITSWERAVYRRVPDQDLRKRLTPQYTPGCKRLVPSSDSYPALLQPHVELVTDPIERLTGRGVVTGSGPASTRKTLRPYHQLSRTP